MAVRGVLLAALMGVTLFPTPAPPKPSRQDPPPVSVMGLVDIVSGPNQTLLVLLDQDTADRTVDGLVDLAFRLQGAPAVAFTGRATITYGKARVSVVLDEETGWVFTVAGRIVPGVEAETAIPHYNVLGLSRFWGTAVNSTPALLAGRLLSGGSCGGTLDTGPKCDSCQVGGPEFTSCAMPCGGGTCSAECADNQFACCNCPLGCGCCPRINGGR